MTRFEWLTVGGPLEPWQQLGLIVDHDGMIPLFGTGIRLVDDGDPGLRGWALSGGEPGAFHEIDGLPTELVPPSPPRFAEHSIGAIGLDHVVIVSDDLERTTAAIAAATGAPCKRVREVGEIRQGFHRLGSLVVEVVERRGLPAGPATFWGLVLNVEDLDAAVERLGPDVIGEAKPAVQPGRSIATVRGSAGLGLPVALMSPG
ncbi:MAG: glyoxalase [Ilumatobacteraceae bacterium]